MNSIIWKGVPSTTINGLLISELPPITVPAMRIKETTIDGRDGSIIEDLGYSSYDKEVVIGLYGNFDINKVIKYFTGEGEVVFSNEPDKVYTAKVVGQIDYNRLLRYRQATIPFRAQPFKHKLNEAYKPAPTESVSGTSIVVDVAADAKIKTFSIYGKTTQNGTPTPDSPVDLVSVGDGGSITVSVTDGTEAKSVAVETPNGLPGIPVSSGGNYTDANGQQWICDEIDLARGVYIKRVDKTVYDGSVDEYWAEYGEDSNRSFYVWPAKAVSGARLSICDRFENVVSAWYSSNATKYGIYADHTSVIGKYFRAPNASITTLAQWNAWLAENPTTLVYVMATPIETALTEEEIATYKTLQLNEYASNITNNENAYMKLEHFETYEVFNEGLETSKPIMVLKGEGTVVISVNGYEIFQYTFPEGENEVVIDSEKEDAYLGDVLKNRNMNGEFPVLLPGTNIIEWSGYVSGIEILPRSRWL